MTIKAYYRALTTTKEYIVIEDVSTIYIGYKYIATNNLKEKYLEYPYHTIATEHYFDNLEQLNQAYNDMMDAWTNCYYDEWSDFLKKYDLTPNMVIKIKRLLKDS